MSRERSPVVVRSSPRSGPIDSSRGEYDRRNDNSGHWWLPLDGVPVFIADDLAPAFFILLDGGVPIRDAVVLIETADLEINQAVAKWVENIRSALLRRN